MSIADKIEEIRKKPEHIRMRYVWFFVAISMVFIVALWAISLQIPEQESVPENEADSGLFNSGILDQFGEQKKVLEDTQENFQNSLLAPEGAALDDISEDEINME